jgi:glucose-6-phosphate isomerase
MGEVIGENPFDQPGVEEGKVYIRENLIKQKELKAASKDQSADEVHRLRLGRN